MWPSQDAELPTYQTIREMLERDIGDVRLAALSELASGETPLEALILNRVEELTKGRDLGLAELELAAEMYIAGLKDGKVTLSNIL